MKVTVLAVVGGRPPAMLRNGDRVFVAGLHEGVAAHRDGRCVALEAELRRRNGRRPWQGTAVVVWIRLRARWCVCCER